MIFLPVNGPQLVVGITSFIFPFLFNSQGRIVFIPSISLNPSSLASIHQVLGLSVRHSVAVTSTLRQGLELSVGWRAPEVWQGVFDPVRKVLYRASEDAVTVT